MLLSNLKNWRTQLFLTMKSLDTFLVSDISFHGCNISFHNLNVISTDGRNL
jgi:hypothetical protein